MKRPAKAAAKRRPAAKAAASRRRPAARRPAAKAMKAMKAMKAKAKIKSWSLKALALITKARDLKSFKDAVEGVANVNRIADHHPDWVEQLLTDRYARGGVAENKAKLEILLNAGLSVDTPDLVRNAVWGWNGCLTMLLRRGAHPLGDQTRWPWAECPFVAAVQAGYVQRLRELKKALKRHFDKEDAKIEWQEAVERIQEDLLRRGGRRYYIQDKKDLRDEMLRHVDESFVVHPAE